MKIIDTHLHLWDMERFRFSWCQGIPKLNRSFCMPDYLAAIRGLGIEKSVHVEADVDEPYLLEETRYILGLAQAADNPLTGVVAAARPARTARVLSLSFSLLFGEVHPMVKIRSRLVCILIMAGISAVLCRAQNGEPFSAAPEYKAMLSELARRAPRPSRISNAGELVRTRPSAFPIKMNENSAGLQLETSLFRLEIASSPFQLSFHNKKTGAVWNFGGKSSGAGGIRWTERPEQGGEAAMPLIQVTRIRKVDGYWLLQCKVGGSSHPVELEVAAVSPGILCITTNGLSLGNQAQIDFHMRGNGPFFGLGEQFVRANLDNLKIDLHPSDRFGTPGHNWSYMSVPFVYSPHAIGIYFDTAYDVHFDSTQDGEEGFKTEIAGPEIDWYLMAAEKPSGILTEYTSLTGRPPLPPPWAFGVWHNSLQGAETVLEDAKRIRAERIPMSALWVSDMMDSASNLGWPGWTYGYYGSPKEFNDKLHALGFRVLGYVHPYVRPLLLPYRMDNPTFQYGLQHHYFVTKPDGQPDGPAFEPCPTANIDFTNPQAVDWWHKMIYRILVDFNFDGWMEDFGEWVHNDDQFAAKRTGRVMAALNPLFYHKITYEIMHEIKPSAIEFSRSAAAGSQAFTPVMWGGDQEPNWSSDHGLPAVVTAGITAGLSGFAVWGPDILSSGRSKELWMRWLEFGALTPAMRDHLWDKPQFAVDLWFDQDTIDTFRRYARLHISLFPYFYTFAHEAAQDGLPIIRHLMLAWPQDPKTYATEYEYLLGDRILVAPVVKQGADTRRLYLPEGSWVDYWNNKIVQGGREVTVPAPLREVPLLVKAGAIVPFIDPDTQTLAVGLAGSKYRTLGTGLTWRVFPSGGASHSTFKLYDGSSATVEQGPSTIRVEGKSSLIRAYNITLPVSRAPAKAILGNTPLAAVSASGYRAGKEGWWLDNEGKVLHVLFTAGNFSLTVTR